MDYTSLYSKNLPIQVDSPAGLRADVKYVFSITNACPGLMDSELYSDGLRAVMREEASSLAGYPPPQGHEGLREIIADGLKEKRGIDKGLEPIFLSDGAAGACRIIFNALIDPGDTVLVEEFSYSGTLGMLLSRGANVIHIPSDEDGMDTDALEETIKTLAAQGRQPKLIYAISVYHNPTGVTLSLDRRKRMVEISQRYGIPILENESYADFRIDGDPLPPAMMGMDDQDSVMYVSSYTKLLGCGLRLGYGAVPRAVWDMLEARRPSHLAAMMVYGYLREHKDEHIEKVRQSIQAKRDAMLAALGENFPPECTWTRPTGGMMVWGKLREGANTWAALDKAVEAGVKYNPGGVFRAGRDCNHYFRLAFSHNTPEEIREGVAILADVFQREGLFDT